jgi:hypothetical protein
MFNLSLAGDRLAGIETEMPAPGPGLEPGHIENVPDVKFDVVMYASTNKHGIEIQCHYRAEYFKKERIAYMMDHYKELLERIAADPGKTLQDYLFKKKKKRFQLG